MILMSTNEPLSSTPKKQTQKKNIISKSSKEVLKIQKIKSHKRNISQ